MQIERGNAADLRFPNGSFDIVFQFTVFTSILDPDLKRKVAAGDGSCPETGRPHRVV